MKLRDRSWHASVFEIYHLIGRIGGNWTVRVFLGYRGRNHQVRDTFVQIEKLNYASYGFQNSFALMLLDSNIAVSIKEASELENLP